MSRRVALAAVAVLLLAGCSSNSQPANAWVEDEVTFDAAGLTVHGTYRHQHGDRQGPAALLISESGRTDRNGDNNVAGPIGNMRQLAEYLSDHGVASLRYDKVGTGKTGLGPYADHPADVGSAVYTTGAKAAVRFLANEAATDKNHISVYGLGEGTVHAMTLADDTSAGAPKIHAVGLLQPLAGRYLDLITNRVRADVAASVKAGQKNQQQADQTIAAWTAAVEQARKTGTAPAQLPDGLSAILNPGNVKAVVESDAIDPLKLAAAIPAATPVLLTCSDSDGQANCADITPLADALEHTSLSLVALKGVNHVLRDDPSDNVGNYSKPGPLSPQLTAALNAFINS
ncbi:secreted protein [Mycolicibacterium aichiense]|nr:secreted protein [Mycolicibacterium aichiense]